MSVKAEDCYNKLVEQGIYDRAPTGLRGKYDNVRRYWEDAVTVGAIGKFLDNRQSPQIRVLDLGCGSGEGYELLSRLRSPRQFPLELEYYGTDISEGMIAKAVENCPSGRGFWVGDLSEGLPVAENTRSFDVYYSSYAVLPYLTPSQLFRLLRDIAAHMDKSAIVVLDMLGRYSWEWTDYWNRDEATMLPYSMSWLYDDPVAALSVRQMHSSPMCYWTAADLDALVQSAAIATNTKIRAKSLTDRSVLVGRHMHTREYSPYSSSIRQAVNSLFEPNTITEFDRLYFQMPAIAPSLPAIYNSFFASYSVAWNNLVEQISEIAAEQSRYESYQVLPASLDPFEIRANIIEPQCGYLLRNLENQMQLGLGAAHGLIAIYELARSDRVTD